MSDKTYNSKYEATNDIASQLGAEKEFDSTFEAVSWIANNIEAAGGIPEAPEDDKTYGRKNGDWTELSESGGPMSGSDTIDITDNVISVKAYYTDLEAIEPELGFNLPDGGNIRMVNKDGQGDTFEVNTRYTDIYSNVTVEGDNFTFNGENVATESYVDDKIGDINTALETIIGA